MSDFLNKKDLIINQLVNIKKFIPYNLDKSLVREMMEYNIKLVWLNENIIPETVIQGMNNTEYDICDVNYIRSNYKSLSGEQEDNDIMNIFENI